MYAQKIISLSIVLLTTNLYICSADTVVSTDIIAEGKTKIIRPCNSKYHDPSDNTLVLIESKDDITAGDGERHDILPGKAELATITTSHVFKLLAKSGIPVAFREQNLWHNNLYAGVDDGKNKKTFLAELCTMIPYEVVIRGEADGSYVKRTNIPAGTLLPNLVVEFFLKTEGKKWQGEQLPCDDPLAIRANGKLELYRPSVPLEQQKPCKTYDIYPLSDKPELFGEIEGISRKVFTVIANKWTKVGGRLVDLKIEFGFNSQNKLVVADVIDNDSWRVIHDEGFDIGGRKYLDKQVYRNKKADLATVLKLYQKVASFTATFNK